MKLEIIMVSLRGQVVFFTLNDNSLWTWLKLLILIAEKNGKFHAKIFVYWTASVLQQDCADGQVLLNEFIG